MLNEKVTNCPLVRQLVNDLDHVNITELLHIVYQALHNEVVQSSHDGAKLQDVKNCHSLYRLRLAVHLML